MYSVALAPGQEKVFEKVPRHGYLSEAMKKHLLAGVAAGTIQERELIELGKRIKQHIADRKGKPEYESLTAVLRKLEGQALQKTPDAALAHLLVNIPKTEGPVTKAVKAAASAVIRVVRREASPTPTRHWRGVESNVVSVQVVQAPKGETRRFEVHTSKYEEYIERLLNRTTTRRSSFTCELDGNKLAKLFPGRPELVHSVFHPLARVTNDWWYNKGAVKKPEIVVEPLIEIPPKERERAREEISARKPLTVGRLVGHKVHVFEKGAHTSYQKGRGVRTSNEEQAITLARKMARFFKHDVQVVKHYDY